MKSASVAREHDKPRVITGAIPNSSAFKRTGVMDTSSAQKLSPWRLSALAVGSMVQVGTSPPRQKNRADVRAGALVEVSADFRFDTSLRCHGQAHAHGIALVPHLPSAP
jgi:hypothetical protein